MDRSDEKWSAGMLRFLGALSLIFAFVGPLLVFVMTYPTGPGVALIASIVVFWQAIAVWALFNTIASMSARLRRMEAPGYVEPAPEYSYYEYKNAPDGDAPAPRQRPGKRVTTP